MNEFKVGQKYIVDCEASCENGNTIQITEIEGNHCYYNTIKGNYSKGGFSIGSIFSKNLIPVEQKIIITTDGKTTTARLYEGGKNLIKTAEAKCSPSDTFDFETGAKLAFERLFEKEKAIEAPKFKVGNKVRIIGHTGIIHAYNIGEIVTIESIDTDGDLRCVNSRGMHQCIRPVDVKLVNETALDWEAFKAKKVYVLVTEDNVISFLHEAKKHGLTFKDQDENFNFFKSSHYGMWLSMEKLAVKLAGEKYGEVLPECKAYISVEDETLKISRKLFGNTEYVWGE